MGESKFDGLFCLVMDIHALSIDVWEIRKHKL